MALNKTATLSIFNTIVFSLASNTLQLQNSLQLVSPSNCGKYSSPINKSIFPIDLFKSPAWSINSLGLPYKIPSNLTNFVVSIFSALIFKSSIFILYSLLVAVVSAFFSRELNISNPNISIFIPSRYPVLLPSGAILW